MTTDHHNLADGKNKQERSLFDFFDKTFLMILAFQYVNQGSMVMMDLALQDVLKTHYGIQPTLMQKATTICALPFSFKLIYGFIADNIPLFGSKKKSYLLLWSMV